MKKPILIVLALLVLSTFPLFAQLEYCQIGSDDDNHNLLVIFESDYSSQSFSSECFVACPGYEFSLIDSYSIRQKATSEVILNGAKEDISAIKFKTKCSKYEKMVKNK